MAGSRLERRIAISSALIASGLSVQEIAHLWVHPLAFIAFLTIGAPLVAGGVALFLYSLASNHD
jgi:hypothetical protein